MQNTTSGKGLLQIKDLKVSYGEDPALDLAELELAQGEILIVIGPNGSGKTTLLKALAGLIPHSDGLHTVAKGISYLPQHDELNLSLPMTVAGVVELANIGKPGNPCDTHGAIKLLGLDKVAGKLISDISGGQLQRALLARSLAQDAELLLLDEPTNELDVATQSLVERLLKEQAEQGKGVIITTHDLAMAKRLGTKVLLLNQKLIAIGAPEEVLTAENLRQVFQAGSLQADQGGDIILTEHIH